jgi:hypothetical protein
MKEFRSEEAFTPLATRTASRHPSSILRDYNIISRRPPERDYITSPQISSFTATRVRRPTNRSHLCCCNEKGVLMHVFSARLVASLIAKRVRYNG